MILSPEELIEKLAALAPPPRLNLVRYHGVLAAAQGCGRLAAGETHHATDRDQIVPGPQLEEAPKPCGGSPSAGSPRAYRLPWSQLLARVFQLDVTLCPACGGRLKIVAALTEFASIRHYLEGVGLPARPPPMAPARPHPQAELDYAAA